MVDFREHLRRQLDYIIRSSNHYDEGNIEEAPRIATALRVLFHRTNLSTPLVDHLGVPDVQLLSTVAAPYRGAVWHVWYGLTDLAVGGNGDRPPIFKPKLDHARMQKLIPLSEWWDGEIVYLREENGTSVEIKRRDIVLEAANTDGGAHVDSHLRPKYEDLEKGFGMKAVAINNDVRREMLPVGAHYAALRQMAYEVVRSPHLVILTAPSA